MRHLTHLRKAKRVFAGISEGRPVDAAGFAATDISDQQLQSPADGCIGAVALTQCIASRIHADMSACRTVNDYTGDEK